jgi:hypothetical protein
VSVAAHDLELLSAKSDGLPDIKIVAYTAVRSFENRYNFDGQKYQPARRTSLPIGEEIPRNVSDFETRAPVIQEAGENPDSVFTEARAWLWQQWKLKKPSYLGVMLHSKEGDETTTTYFIRKSGGNLEVMILKHRVSVDRVPHPGSRRPAIDEIDVVAAHVERRMALKDSSDRQTSISDDQKALPDSYEIYFNDDAGNDLAVLQFLESRLIVCAWVSRATQCCAPTGDGRLIALIEEGF